MLSVFRMYGIVIDFFKSVFNDLDLEQLLAYQNTRLRVLAAQNGLSDQASRRRRKRRRF